MTVCARVKSTQCLKAGKYELRSVTVAVRDAVRIGPPRVQPNLSGEPLEMSGTEEAAPNELHDFLQLRESAERRLRVGPIEV